ncbi:MBOAT family O-acyltransferase [Butyrivibrio sp. XBB1001]|uniref:MBOAT family O-acyltransferase n=1 Tax=Butyrivibrio sp. XBB1001 TaxID=1280682 RepID=UPI000408BE7C|nr:MBOAT family O-acyltransferase [Butyrivibrio sp. XBB1001]
MPVYTKLFIAFFLCVFFTFYFILQLFRKNARRGAFFSNGLIFLASVVFYAWDDVRFIPVLLVLGIVTYVSGLVLEGVGNGEKSRGTALYVLFMVLELGPIVVARFIGLFSSVGVIGARNLLVPLGLSFFTLQAFTYTDAVYRGRLKADRNILNVLTFVSLFPCVSSGPIQRAEKLLPQIQKVERSFDYDEATDGLKLIVWGLVKKLVIADNLAIYIQNVRGAETSYGSALLLSAIFYSFQLYLDFSGYSDIVIGAAKALGFDLGLNFDHPYLSQSVGEFWRRWHISLSSWLRDYVYIPLGGSRVSPWKIYRNLLITFAVSGLWHGAGITWIIWGLYHGAWLCIERALGSSRKMRDSAGKLSIGKVILTFVIVTIGWIMFSSASVGEFWNIVSSFAKIPGEVAGVAWTEGFVSGLKALFMVTSDAHVGTSILGLVAFGIISSYTYGTKTCGLEIIRKQNAVVRWCGYFALILLILLFGAANSAEFIYNRF